MSSRELKLKHLKMEVELAYGRFKTPDQVLKYIRSEYTLKKGEVDGVFGYIHNYYQAMYQKQYKFKRSEAGVYYVVFNLQQYIIRKEDGVWLNMDFTIVEDTLKGAKWELMKELFKSMKYPKLKLVQ